MFSLMPAAAFPAVSLPHTHHFDTVSPWTQVYTGSALDSSTSAPGSSSSSLRFRYGRGMKNGTAPDKVWVNISPAATEIWVQYWFKYSSGFYYHAVDNKQLFHYIGSSSLSTNWYTSVVGRKMNMVYQRTPGSGRRTGNTGYNPTIQDDVWYKVTTRSVLNTNGAANGIFQLWVNDGLVIDYSNIPYLTGADTDKECNSLAFDPVFGGGTPARKPATDYFYVDYVQVRTRSFGSSGGFSGSSSGDDSLDPAIPTAPANIPKQ
jgi:hypothetical protein